MIKNKHLFNRRGSRGEVPAISEKIILRKMIIFALSNPKYRHVGYYFFQIQLKR